MPNTGQAKDCHPPDTGCRYSPKCVDCPLPECKYDVSAARRIYVHQSRLEAVEAVERQGVCYGAEAVYLVASQRGETTRTIWRSMKKARAS